MRSVFRGLVQNWQLKLLAFALAVLLWVINSAEQITSQWIPVPVEVREEDPDFQLLGPETPREVKVRFTGSGRDLIDVAIRQPPLVLVIPRVNEPLESFALEPDMVRVPSQLQVNAHDVDPGYLQLRFRRVARRSVPVQVVLAEELGPGWTLMDSLQVQPTRVEVRGPSERVDRIDRVRTVPLSLSPAATEFSQLVRLDTTGLSGLDLSADRVQVSGRIDRVVERTLTDVPVSVGPGVAVRPTSVDVSIAGPSSRVRILRPGDFRVVVAIDSIPSQLPAEGLSAPLRLEGLPPSVRATVNPPAVRLVPGRLPRDTVAPPEPGRVDTAGPAEPAG